MTEVKPDSTMDTTQVDRGKSETSTSTAQKDTKMEEITPEELEQRPKIRELLEFYFGDSNLNRDRFLRKVMETDPDAYVTIEILLTFNRLKSITLDTERIARAAQESPLLAVDASRTRIKRLQPVPSNYIIDNKVVYAELFPATYTRESLQELFSKCGQTTTVLIALQKYNTKLNVHKGFAFIEFETVEMAKEAVTKLNTIENPSHHVDAPNGMRVMSKDTWFRFKDELKELKDRLSEANKVVNVAPEPGLIVFFGNVGPDVGSYEAKMAMKQFGPLAYVEYDPETRTGHARFKYPQVAQKACTQMTAEKFKLGGNEVICRVITGKEEQEYWNLIHTTAARKRTNNKPYFNNKNNYNNNNKYNNNNNNNNEHKNNKPYNNKKHLRDSKGEEGAEEGDQKEQPEGEKEQEQQQGGHGNSKKQKRQNKEVKMKGKKMPSIAKAKPKSHVVFGDDGETQELVDKKRSRKTFDDNDKPQTQGTASEDSNNNTGDSKRAKVDEEEKSIE